MKIIYSPKFSREFKKLPDIVKDVAIEHEIIFRKNPFDKRLKTHKLHGRLNGFFLFLLDISIELFLIFTKIKKLFIFIQLVHMKFMNNLH